MLAVAQRPEPTAMLNHRGERIMPLPYRPMPKSKAKTRKLSVMEGEYEHVHLTKKQRSEYNLEPELEPAVLAMHRQESTERNSPFDLHLQAVYEGNAEDGLQFFESHGYYDISDANTVEMFRQNFGLGEGFWLGREEEEEDLVFDTPIPAVYPFGSQQQILSSRNLLHRERTNSGRFTLLDDDGNEVDEHTLWELEREDRLKAKSLELDDDDLAELANDEVIMVQAITFIRSEKIQLQQFFLQAFQEEQARTAHIPGPVLRQPQRTELPPPMPPADLELPPYCGYVNLLKDTIPFLMRSWHKRWFYLDFQAGVVLMYKRSYWKSPRGVIDLRNVAHIEKMSQGDFRIEFHDTGADAPAMMLMRSKTPEEAELWVNLMRFAKQASRGAPRLTNTIMDNTKALMKKANKKNQVDILAQLLQNSANNAPSSNLRAIAQASAVAASAVSRRNSKPNRHHNALTA
ncbi:hypothetical protein F441_20797 [Phytophthora nicotianae CJ01A1]|uniref:PH domain-containing protein n=7 Tax=Phytophthora nicotianae TaxID=4792 RepID=V9DZC2_PHYNI|nr:hypothetical protein F443_20933 [Phytophthora nicotianae P1569]ETO60915.1 hypothetical protein F444_20947 [Phytophthora nicotianae P1976]ETP02043.1 hypothetical protein F441_20797 [Phytophthora nicotianae CJ01A1]KUF95813.1 hypothetical protein AM587_10014088 [Phytophthora nicotianae]